MKPRKPLPRNAVLGLIVAAGLLVLVAGWLLVVSPQGGKASALDRETQATEQQVAQNLAQLHRSPNATPAIRVADLYRLAKAMPSLTDMPDILLELDQTAQAAGVTLTSISPGAATAGLGGYSTIPITLNVTGDFYGLTDLLYRLRNLVSVHDGALQATGRIFSVGSLTLSPGTPNLTAAVTVDTYVYGAAPTTVPAPAPAATDTTTAATTGTTSSGPSAAGAP